MDFISKYGNVFNGLFGTGTDNLTRTPQLYNNGRMNLTSDQEVYDTISDNEFKLFKSTPELFVVFNKKAQMFSNGRWVVKNYKTGEVIENDPLYLFLEQPSPLLSRNEWLMMLSLNYDVFGNVIALVNKGSRLSDVPSSINFLPNGEIKLKQKAKTLRATNIEEIIEYYKVLNTNQEFEPSEIFHLKTSNPENPVLGLSPLHPLQMSISNIRGARGFRNVNITKRGALGIISPDGKDAMGVQQLGEDKRLDIEKQFANDTHGIFQNQAPIKFAQIPVNYQQISYPIKDSLLFEEISEGMMRIIDAVGLNSHIFSQEKGSTFANYQEGLRSAYQDAIIPFAENVCFALNQKLGLFDQNKYIELDYSHISVLQKNQKEEAFTVKMKVESVEKLVSMGYSLQDAMNMVKLSL